MNGPLVSIIIPTYNSARTLERCLQSVANQTYPNIEVLVVDNHSVDETPRIAARYARLITCGSERSAQINEGARQARGAYFYRIDGDFELAPDVVASCVEACSQGLDALAVANRSVGEGYWARVRRLERDTYLDDELVVAARFWRRDAFFAVGGMDEALVACEDLDLHNRLLEAGYHVGRVSAQEIHLGEADHLWDYARPSFYYGPSILRYLRKNPVRGLRQSFPIRPAFVRHWRSFLAHPALLPGLVALKTVQYAAAIAGMACHALGLVTGRGKIALAALLALVLVAATSFGLSTALADLGFSMATGWKVALTAAGVGLWQAVGRRRAHLLGRPLADVLLPVALAYSPLLVHLLATAGRRGARSNPGDAFLVGWLLALWAAALAYLAQLPGRPERRLWDRIWGPLVGLAAATFVGVLGLRACRLIETFSLPVFDLTVVDQALWAAAQGWPESLTSLLHSSVLGRSLFADRAAPLLLPLVPLYRLGVGGPSLLTYLHLVGIALSALVLFRLGRRRLDPLPAGLIALAYITYFVPLQAGLQSFRVEAWIAPLLLLAIDRHERGEPRWAYLPVILALACGFEAGPAVAMLGSVLWIRGNRQDGFITLALGVGWTWLVISALIPLFGGTSDGVLAPYLQAEYPRSLVDGVTYLARLIAPLGLLPLLGWPTILLALPRLALNLAGGPAFTSLAGGLEVAIAPLLFLATLDALRWLRDRAAEAHQFSPAPAGSVLVLAGCLFTSLNLVPVVGHGLTTTVTDYHLLGRQILSEVPADASLAVQGAFGPAVAHRRQLTILPRVEQPDYVFVDLFSYQREGPVEPYQEVLRRISHHPDYGLRRAEGGYLLFERGLDPAANLTRLVSVADPDIAHPRRVTLGGEVVYLGMDLSAAYVDAGDTFYVTHYWQRLGLLSHPYRFFTGYPGGAQFEPFAFGLYPIDEWEEGEVIRHTQPIRLPALPNGDAYELVVGLWHGEGEPALRAPTELLGRDVIRVALISARDGHYQIIPWPDTAQN